MLFILQNVTDEQLMASSAVTFLFMLILLVAGLINLRKIVKPGSMQAKILRSLVMALLIVGLVLSYRTLDLEVHLLMYPEYTEGTTVEFGNVFMRGEGIIFEYEVNGIKYRNCNTFHPVSRSGIVVPGGRFMVRHAEGFESEGRIDWSRPAP